MFIQRTKRFLKTYLKTFKLMTTRLLFDIIRFGFCYLLDLNTDLKYCISFITKMINVILDKAEIDKLMGTY